MTVNRFGRAAVLASAGRLRPLDEDAAASALGAAGVDNGAGGMVRLRDAAVLIALMARPDGPADDGLDVILTRRTEALRIHSGQIALPGGKIDADDGSAVAAALREAQEEIGLPTATVEPLGLLSPFLTLTGFRVFPVVGLIVGQPELVANPGEVAEVFSVPLDFVLDPANHREEWREADGQRRRLFAMHYDRHRIWGVTAGILRRFYEEVFA